METRTPRQQSGGLNSTAKSVFPIVAVIFLLRLPDGQLRIGNPLIDRVNQRPLHGIDTLLEVGGAFVKIRQHDQVLRGRQPIRLIQQSDDGRVFRDSD